MSKIPSVKNFRILFLLRMREDLLGYLTKLHNEYGDIFQKYYRQKNHYFTRNPEHAEHILSSNQGNFKKNDFIISVFKPFIGDSTIFTSNNLPQWERDRKVQSTAFDSEVFFDSYAKTIAEKCQSLLNDWHQKIKNGEDSILLRPEIDTLLTHIIKDTIFYHLDIDVNDMIKNVSIFLEIVTEKIQSISPFAWIFPTKKKRIYQGAIDYARELGIKALRSRLQEGRDYDDLLGSLIDSYEIKEENSPGNQEVRNTIVFNSLVSYLNTSSVIAWALVMIANHPEIETKLVEEARQVCNGNSPSYRDFLKLTYMHAFIHEVLRLYPVACMILRDSISDDEINGFPILANSAVFLSVFHAHRHPDYWQFPEKFDPERFINKPWGQDYQFAYFPFGAGKRRCIAKNFAFMEVCLIVASIIQHFHLGLINDEKARIVNLMAIQIRPSIEKMSLQKQR